MENPEGNTRNTKSTSNKVKKLWPLAVVIVIVVGFLVASHSKPATTAINVKKSQTTSSTANTQSTGTSSQNNTNSYPTGGVGSTLTIASDVDVTIKLIKIISPYTYGESLLAAVGNTTYPPPIAAEFEVTANTTGGASWSYLSQSLVAFDKGNVNQTGPMTFNSSEFRCTSSDQPPVNFIQPEQSETACIGFDFPKSSDKISTIGYYNGVTPVAVWKVN